MFLFNKQYCDLEKVIAGVLGTGKMAFISRERDRNRRIKIIMGNREHKITNFRWGGGGGGGGGQGNTPLYFRRTWGHLPPPLWEGLANVSSAKHTKA